MENLVDLQKLYCIDGHDLGLPERTGTYVLDERPNGAVTLIETGPSISIPYVKRGLASLNIQLEEIHYIIVTHIHLDHAGGAGLLLKDCPNAQVLVHPKGKRHLNDPSRLVQGARAIYQDKFDQMFEPVIPITQERLQEMDHGKTLKLSEERLLTFYDTPGHAKHHLGIHDSRTNTFFTGDTCGIRYPAIERAGVSFYLPSTSPNQFNPDDMIASIHLIKDIKPENIAFGHFGISKDPDSVYEQMETWIPLFVEKGKDVVSSGGDWTLLKTTLKEIVTVHLKHKGLKEIAPVMDVIDLDLTISAMGVMDYLRKTQD